MERRRLGKSDLEISRIGLGTWAIGGGDWILGWGPQNDGQSVATIRRAVEHGVNWIDTASAYGLGRAETIIARALRAIPSRAQPFVFTKCGLVWDDLGNIRHDLTPASIRSQAEDSLRRLQRDCIDMYQIGWPTWPPAVGRGPAGALDAAWEAMASLQAEGKVRFIGISNCDAERLARLQHIAPVTSLETPYSLLRRDAEDRTLPFCASHEIGMIACSTLGAGLLTAAMTPERACSLPCNDWRRRHAFLQELAATGTSRPLERLRAVARRLGQPPAVVAIAWALRHAGVTAAAVGARHPHQVDEIVQAASVTLSAQDIDDLEHAHALPGR